MAKFEVIILLFISGLLPAQTQRLMFERFSYAEGLPVGVVNCLLEDRQGFIWAGGTRGLARYDGNRFETFSFGTEDTCGVATMTVNCLLQDRKGQIWAGTSSGLSRLDKFRHCFDPIRENGTPVLSLVESSSGKIWAATGEELYFVEEKNGQPFLQRTGFPGGVQALLEGPGGQILAGIRNTILQLGETGKTTGKFPIPATPGLRPPLVKCLFRDSENRLWIGTENGLFRREEHSGQIVVPDNLPPLLRDAWVFDIAEYGGFLWLATRGEGMVKWKPGGTWQQFTNHPFDPFSPSDIHLRAVLPDRSGALWTGGFSGLNKTRFTNTHFPYFHFEPDANTGSDFILKMAAGHRGELWAYVRQRGVFQAAALGERAVKTNFPVDGFLDGKDLKSMCADSEGGIWLIRNLDGLYRLTTDRGSWHPFPVGDTLTTSFLRIIQEDVADKRHLWISTSDGFCRVDKRSGERQWFLPQTQLAGLPDNAVNYFDQASDGTIWVSFGFPRTRALGSLDTRTGRFQMLSGNLPLSGLQQIKVDGKHVWFLFERQIARLETSSGQLESFFPFVEMPEVQLAAGQPDSTGRFWFSGGQYIGCLDPADGSFRYYQQPEMEIFVSGCTAALSGGWLAFGGKNGICAFQPALALPMPAPPRPVLTSIHVRNSKVNLGAPPELITSLTLGYSDNDFSFGFVALQSLSPAHIHYAYRLENFEKEWQKTEQGQQAAYTNVPPGRYLFRVRAASPDGVWGEEELKLPVRILPPWWMTWQFRLLVAGVLAAAGYGFYRYQLRRRLEKEETHRLKKLDAFKTRLYTNITHEFRTPLTLIVSPAARIKNELEMAELPGLAEELQRMERQGQHLLNLVGQILDLNKLQAGKMDVNWVQGDVMAFLRYMCDCFLPMSVAKNIELRTGQFPTQFFMDYDPEKWQVIVSNLLSNALKFTESGGTVLMETEVSGKRDPVFKIIISDSGRGIPPVQLERLFERFSSGTEDGSATGIGLSLVRELTQLLGGSIGVESLPDKGATFTVSLPVHNRAPMEQQERQGFLPFVPLDEAPPNSGSQLAGGEELPLLLLAEDHDDTAAYLKKCLSGKYRVLRARDGQEGLDLAFSQIPDLVVSDLMMPRVNGYELCQRLKTDERTSHVPVVLLTSRSETDARLEGLRHGADDYLAKPFHEGELLLRLQNLLATRQRLQESYANAVRQGPVSATHPPLDDFLKKLWEAVDANLSRSDFDVPLLCREIGLSRTQLHRKVVALTGDSITKFIHTVRFAHAIRLLVQTQLTISEVAYECGFSDPGYFTKLFSKEYGETPTEFRERNIIPND